MSLSLLQLWYYAQIERAVKRLAALVFALLATTFVVCAQAEQLSKPQSASDAAIREDVAPLVIEGTSDADVFGLGRSIVVRGAIKKGAIAFGGDVIIEGTVEGDVAAIGGSVFQQPHSRIGGDVMVIGGAYHHGKTAPERNPDSTTVMYAGYEQELRQAMREPATLVAPRWSIGYLGWRMLSALLWFVASLALTSAAPDAVSRAAARLQLTSLPVAVIGCLSAVVLCVGVPVCLWMLPGVVGVLIGMAALGVLLAALLFGRVVVHAATGRWIERRLMPESKRSESTALLTGACVWTLLTSLPYVWPVIVAGLLVTSLGLMATARSQNNWRSNGRY